MAYTKYSLTPANNNAAPPDGAPEGMLPSAVNDTMRDMMAQIRDCGDGIRGGTYTMTAPVITGGAITGSTINNAVIGGTTRAAGSFTTVTTTNDSSISGLTVGKGGGAVASNTAVGASALAGSNTGGFNSAFGNLALQANTSGQYNTAIGRVSLYNNTTASFNTGLGNDTLFANTTGNNNTALGYAALTANTTASNNTAVGYQAGYSNTTGNNSVMLGRLAGYSATISAQNTFIGANAGYSSNVTAGGNGYNTFVGYAAGYSSTTGYNNTFVGSNGNGTGAGHYVTTGIANTILGAYNGNQGGLDIRTASNYIVLSDGDGNPRLQIDGSGTLNVPGANAPSMFGVYNNTTASAANVNVLSSGALIRSTSALKYKTDIRDLELIDINKFRPVRYKSKCENDDPTKDHIGIVADEVDQVGIKELVNYGADCQVEGFQYERLTVVLLKTIQDLQKRIEILEKK